MRKLRTTELNRLSVDEFKSSAKIHVVIVLDNIRSQNNIGSVFRTGDAFRIEAIYLCGITATPPHREINKTALGATESVNWKYFGETKAALESLRQEDYLLLGVEQTNASIPLNEFHPDKEKKYALIFGNEVNGLDEALIPFFQECIEIPQYGTKHSLNISVAAGIVVWDIFSKLNYIL
ncbi:MAG: TrmH family RNA methyltransferase [Bacteroidales bacterium]|jgi:tRNA G18 (ribose-2'-O)-methylase SpoU